MHLIKMKYFLKNNKKLFLYTWIFSIIFILSSDFAFAGNNDEIKALSTAIDIVNLFLGLVWSTLWVVTAFVSWFLSPEWYNWKLFWLDWHFKQIWILVSNIVYTAFAIILIVIAFMNIINKWDKWELKQALPRFIIWVLIVPLSWFFVQFVLSISSIMTISVITLPYEIFNNWVESELWWKIDLNHKIHTTHILKLWDESEFENDICHWKNTNTNEERVPWWFMMSCNPKPIREILKWTAWEWDNSTNNTSVFGLMSIFTYEIMRLDRLDTLRSEFTVEAIKTITSLFQKSIFDLAFIVIYTVLMIALFLALFVRGVMLWLYTMFSPMFWLLYFFWKSSDGVWWDTKFSIKDFISLALVPVYVSWALAFWLIFIFVIAWNSDNKLLNTEGNDNCLISWWVFKFCLEWKIWDDINEWIYVWKWALWRFIIEMFGVVVLWVSVMAALKSSTTTWNIIKPIEDFGKQVWWLVMRSPMYAPVIPTKWGMQSAWSMFQAGKTITSQISNINQDKWNKLASSFLPGLFGWEQWKKYLDLLTESNAINGKWPKAAYDLKERIYANWTADDLAKNIQSRRALANTFRELYKDATDSTKSKEIINELEKATSWTEIKRLLSELDKIAKSNTTYTALWGAKNITRNQVEDYLWKGKTNPDEKDKDQPILQVKEGVKKDGIKTYEFLDMNIEINKDQQTFTEESDYKDIANKLLSKSYIWKITLNNFKDLLYQMWIRKEEKQKAVIEKIQNSLMKKDWEIVLRKDWDNSWRKLSDWDLFNNNTSES